MSCNRSVSFRNSESAFLMILFGTLEFDGRAQRVIEVLTSLGSVVLIDIKPKDMNLENNWIRDVERIKVPLPRKEGKITRHLILLWHALNQVRRTKPKIVVAANYFTLAAGCLAARISNAKLVYDAYELLIPDPGLRMNWRDRFWYSLERGFVKYADLVIAANEERASLMQEHYHLDFKPTVVQNIPQIPKISEDEKNGILLRYPQLVRRTARDRLIYYQGFIDLSRLLDRFMGALNYLPKEYRMVIVGDGPDFERLRNMGRAFEREDRFIMLGRIEHRLLPLIASLMDVGIVTYPSTGLNNIYCAPNKVFEYAQAGIPIIATNQPTLRRLIQGYRVGRLVEDPENPEHIAEIIKDVAENKDLYRQALADFVENHRWEKEAEKLRTALLGILTT